MTFLKYKVFLEKYVEYDRWKSKRYCYNENFRRNIIFIVNLSELIMFL